MFIPYTNREIRVVKYSQLHRYYTKDECNNLQFQLNDEINSWRDFLKDIPLNRFWICIIHKSAIHRLKCFYNTCYEIKNAIDNETHLIASLLLLKKHVVKGSLFRFIDCVSAIIQCCSFGTYIIKQVQKKLRIWLIPHLIIKPSVIYWKKYLLTEYGLNDVIAIEDFINKHNLKNVLKWEELLLIY